MYHECAGDERVGFDADMLSHIKARRMRESERLEMRNLKDECVYIYEIRQLSRRDGFAELVFTSQKPVIKSGFCLAWAVIDPKSVQKALPALNELGVERISFIYCDYSQKNFRLDFDKLERICALSSQQCGREYLMSFELYESLDKFIASHENVALLDFGGEALGAHAGGFIVVGAEGGFSQRERELVRQKYSLNTISILRSETAAIALAAKSLA
ncbi:RsmE family RNA methyltransferase [Campylobacter sp. 19-13652]|uniref:RsmE family RNA methyltransferase n=1 Tax=Campylobacter sp. 19-13652 TaxID=2840180 RepID=UPI0021A8092B|nr:RsmE family RNA methyltransferase [Campylobacter sp. 19-13652]